MKNGSEKEVSRINICEVNNCRKIKIVLFNNFFKEGIKPGVWGKDISQRLNIWSVQCEHTYMELSNIRQI